MQGEFRSTNDLDIICDLLPKHLPHFFDALGDGFIVDRVAVELAVKNGTTCNIIHDQSFIKIDLFFARDEIRQLQLQRVAMVSLPGMNLNIKVATPEDIILAKLAWFKKGGETSERQ